MKKRESITIIPVLLLTITFSFFLIFINYLPSNISVLSSKPDKPVHVLDIEKLVIDDSLNTELTAYVFIKNKLYYFLNAYIPQSNTCKYSTIIEYDLDEDESSVIYKIDFDKESSGITTISTFNDQLYWLEQSVDQNIMRLDLNKNVSLVKHFKINQSVNYLDSYNNGVFWIESSNNRFNGVSILSNDKIEKVNIDIDSVRSEKKIVLNSNELFYFNKKDPEGVIRKMNMHSGVESKLVIGNDITNVAANSRYIVWVNQKVEPYVIVQDLKLNSIRKLSKTGIKDSINSLIIEPNGKSIIFESNDSTKINSKSLIQVDMKTGNQKILYNSTNANEKIWCSKKFDYFIVLEEMKERIKLEIHELRP